MITDTHQFTQNTQLDAQYEAAYASGFILSLELDKVFATVYNNKGEILYAGAEMFKYTNESMETYGAVLIVAKSSWGTPSKTVSFNINNTISTLSPNHGIIIASDETDYNPALSKITSNTTVYSKKLINKGSNTLRVYY